MAKVATRALGRETLPDMAPRRSWSHAIRTTPLRGPETGSPGDISDPASRMGAGEALALGPAGPVHAGDPGSIIPSPGSPGIAPNVTATLTLSSVSSGTTYFSADMPTTNYGEFYPFFGTALIRTTSSLINDGTIWHRVHDAFGGTPNLAVVAGALGNNGLIVAEIDQGLVYGAFAYETLTNESTGKIFALAAQGTAFGVMNENPFLSTVRNAGLIAAQGLGQGSAAYGAYMVNGGFFTNLASGTILVEAWDAVGLFFGRGTFPADSNHIDITNAGLIRVKSLDPHLASVGVWIEHVAVETMNMVNRGTIAADIAIYANSYAFSPPQKAAEVIVNEAAGQLLGAIFLDLGDDVIVNSGLIRGAVLMGQGADRVDNSAGTIEGYVDFAEGNDVFLGGAGTDGVNGGRDNDQLEGRGGQDLLVGGWGDDVLIGGAGNDGLFGEGGNDRIVTLAGDFVWGGSGDDRIELGDYSFELADGGGGFDRLVLPAGARVLDLSLAIAADALHGFEAIELGGGKELVVRAADVGALSDNGALRIEGGATDKVDLLGSWTEGAVQVIGGISYRTFTSGGAEAAVVMVAGGSTVVTGGSAPAGATGLDPVASGPLAPLPGEIAGIDLTSEITVANDYFMHESLTVTQDEIWQSEQGQAVLRYGLDRNIVITNDGIIQSTAILPQTAYVFLSNNAAGSLKSVGVYAGPIEVQGSAVAIGTDYIGLVDNGGTIRATALNEGAATAFLTSGSGRLINDGLIEASSEHGFACAVNSFEGGGDFVNPAFLNRGEFRATGGGGAAGVVLHNSAIIVNEGRINVTGGQVAIGLYVQGSTQARNSGEIIATATDPGGTSYGWYLYANSAFMLDNSGLIRADVAVRTADYPGYGELWLTNSGTIEGRFELGYGWEHIWNTGSIAGAMMLGDGNDLYDGTGGTQTGGVFGEGGNDTLIGGSGAESFYGGAGNDTLTGAAGDDWLAGGAGVDILDGGTGSDRFAFLALTDSSEGALDRILAFQTGVDKIDLLAIAGATLSWAQQSDADGAFNLVTVTTVHGELKFRVDGGLSTGDFLLPYSLSQGGAGPETLNGTDNGDELRGDGGADVLIGLGGADLLNGGAGADRLEGGAGDDTYYVDDAGDVVVDMAGNGDDRLITSVSYALGADLEVELLEATGTASLNLSGNVFDQTIRGNAGSNLITGMGGSDILRGDAENDTLFGNDGNDFLVGGTGNDTMVGGLGDDTYYVDSTLDALSEYAGEGFDRIATVITLALAADADIERIDVENLASTNAIDLTGSAIANVIYGNDGQNILRGEAGNDELRGFAGNDYLVGGSGADLMIGGLGDDTFYVDNAGDAIGEIAGQGNDRIAASISFVLSNGADVEILEAVNVADTSAFDLTGSDSANTITGNAGVNFLRGEGGNDVLSGAGGDDFLVGGADYDVMNGGTGNDTYYVDAMFDVVNEFAGEGTADRVVASNSYALSANADVELLETATQSGTLPVTLTGSSTANRINGNDGMNVLDGKGGSDVLCGNGGSDTFAFTTALGANNVDTIVDFTHGLDKIRLDPAIFTGTNSTFFLNPDAFFIGVAAHDADDRIIYDSATGALYYDADGNGAGAAVQFATVGSGLGLTASDFFAM